MYQVKIVSGSIKEINDLREILTCDLWEGELIKTKYEAEAIVSLVSKLKPMVEIEITVIAA